MSINYPLIALQNYTVCFEITKSTKTTRKNRTTQSVYMSLFFSVAHQESCHYWVWLGFPNYVFADRIKIRTIKLPNVIRRLIDVEHGARDFHDDTWNARTCRRLFRESREWKPRSPGILRTEIGHGFSVDSVFKACFFYKEHGDGLGQTAFRFNYVNVAVVSWMW